MIDITNGRNLVFIENEWWGMVNQFFTNKGKYYIVLEKKTQTKPGKRIYFETYTDKLRFQLVNRAIKISLDNKQVLREWLMILDRMRNNIERIVRASPGEIGRVISLCEKKGRDKWLLQPFEDILVSYYEAIAKEYGKKLIDILHLKTCPYCNRQFINSFKGKRWERPEFDHFFSKNKYPVFCISVFNLIPSCHSCNHIKNDNIIGVNPYIRRFNSKFRVTDVNGKELNMMQIFNTGERNIRLKLIGTDAEEELNISELGLEDAYNFHTDYVKEIVDKAMAYNDHARAALVNSFQGAGYHPDQVYDFVWGRYLDIAQQENRPLSKLTKDLLDMMDIK